MTTSLTPIDPARTALLLMDFQPAVLGYVPDPDAVLAGAATALAWARSHDIQVGYVRVAFEPDDYASVPSHSKAFAAVAQSKFLAADSPETQIHPALEVRDGDIVVRKTRFGPFSTTDLGAALRTKGIDTLVLAGISTSGVVLSTVRQAADDDFRVTVLSDAIADSDAEVHRVLVEKVFPHQADVIATAELPTLIG